MRRIAFLVVFLLSSTAAAHKPSDAHLKLDVRGESVTGRLDVAVRDLDAAIGIDDGDGAITYGELEAAAPRIGDYVAQRLTIDGCTLSQGAPALVDLSDGAYWAIPITASCEQTTALTIRYQLLFDIDAQHRGLVHVAGQTLIARDGSPVTAAMGESTSVRAFVREGIWHIWEGIDHILFLLCLLLPAVWRRESAKEVA
ncbi:MAG TPA: HupE/UreJ family protein, partial [Kofleriaceae bacterium]|nr:HupE/UreJ family protein [Kofleriaceae bacterium]